MIYRPAEPDRLWDSWLFAWEGQVHLFYLASMGGEFHVGHAISDDLVHWRRLDDIVTPHWPFTGMIVRHGERFVMGLGEEVDHVQTSVFYESDDLMHWRPMRGATRLRPIRPHYVDTPNARWPGVWWRDPFLFRLPGDEAWHAVVCATKPNDGPDHTGAVLAHVRTMDFATWEHLPPIDGPTGRYFHTEVPEYFEHNGRHYLLFSTGSCGGVRIHTPGRRETVGTYYMMADVFEGPYRLPDDPLLVGAGHYRMASYVARVIEFGGERLLYHHIRDDSEQWDGAWATPKRLVVADDGTLAVRYWPGLAKLETETLIESETVELRHGVAGTTRRLADDAADAQVSAMVRFDGGRCGVVLRSEGGRGVMVSLDADLGHAAIGLARCHPTFGWGGDVTNFLAWPDAERDQRFLLDTCGLALQPGQAYHLRCLVRDEHVEVYLDDRWLFTTHVPDAPRSGGVELFAERGGATFEQVRIARLEPMVRPSRVGEYRIERAGG